MLELAIPLLLKETNEGPHRNQGRTYRNYAKMQQAVMATCLK